MTRTNLRAMAAAATSLVLWASAFVGIRYAGNGFSPGSLSLGRLVVGSVVLGTFVLIRADRRRPAGRDWILLLICGVFWFGIYNVTLNEAERHVDAGIAAMVVNTGPIFVALLAGVALHEGFPRGLFAGGAVGLAGAVLIGVSSVHAGSHADPLGVLLCLVPAVTYSIGVVAQKPVLERVPALTVTWIACTVGLIVCLPFAPSLLHDVTSAPRGMLITVLYLGALPTATAFTTWAYALRHSPAGRLGVNTYFVPPLTLLLGGVLLGEVPSALAIGGGALCIAGVALTRVDPRRLHRHSAAAALPEKHG